MSLVYLPCLQMKMMKKMMMLSTNVKERLFESSTKHQQNKAAMTGATAVNKPKLTQDAVMNLYANCIELASENKSTQRIRGRWR